MEKLRYKELQLLPLSVLVLGFISAVCLYARFKGEVFIFRLLSLLIKIVCQQADSNMEVQE